MTARKYTPRAMPARYLDGAPESVRRNVLDMFSIKPAAPLEYDIVFRDVLGEGDRIQLSGLDFGCYGEQGCHFFLDRHAMFIYRDSNRRKRVAWRDLPKATQAAIVRYCEADE